MKMPCRLAGHLLLASTKRNNVWHVVFYHSIRCDRLQEKMTHPRDFSIDALHFGEGSALPSTLGWRIGGFGSSQSKRRPNREENC